MNQNTPNSRLALRLSHPPLVHSLNGIRRLSPQCQPSTTSGTEYPGLAAGKGRRWEKPPPRRGIMFSPRGELRTKTLGGTGKSDRLQIQTEWNWRAHAIPLPTLREFIMFECGSRGFLTLEVVSFNFNSLHNIIWFDRLERLRRRRMNYHIPDLRVASDRCQIIYFLQ